MGSHPANLILRFILEITALISIGIWGWTQSDNWFGILLGIGIPILLAIIWGTFAVPNDPSRSGSAPIATNGIIRLLIEIAIFIFAIWALKDMEWVNPSLIMAIVVTVHYIASYDRVLWLISK